MQLGYSSAWPSGVSYSMPANITGENTNIPSVAWLAQTAAATGLWLARRRLAGSARLAKAGVILAASALNLADLLAGVARLRNGVTAS